MKNWKKQLLWPLMAVALAFTATQPAFAAPDDDDDYPVATVPDGGSTVLLLAGVCLGAAALRRKWNRS